MSRHGAALHAWGPPCGTKLGSTMQHAHVPPPTTPKQVVVKRGEGQLLVNGQPYDEYFRDLGVRAHFVQVSSRLAGFSMQHVEIDEQRARCGAKREWVCCTCMILQLDCSHRALWHCW